MSNPPPPSDPDLPALDPLAIADDQLLAEAVDAVVLADREARARMEEIFIYVETLRAVLDQDEWKTLMQYDQLANERFSELLLVIARWAFTEGARHGVRPRAAT